MAYDPFREFDELRREIDRSFERARPARRRRLAFLPGAASRQYPLVNLAEDKDNYYVEAVAPGVDISSLELSIDGHVLTIAGEKRPPEGVQKEAFHRSERSAGRFSRRVDLGATVDVAEVSASYDSGMLRIKLPKAPEAKPRQIPITS